VELRVSDGSVVAQANTHGSAGIAFDGANVWAGEFNDNVVGKL